METETVAKPTEITETEPESQKIELAEDGSGSLPNSSITFDERGNMTAEDCTIRGG
jgi:hypothetical protein